MGQPTEHARPYQRVVLWDGGTCWQLLCMKQWKWYTFGGGIERKEARIWWKVASLNMSGNEFVMRLCFSNRLC